MKLYIRIDALEARLDAAVGRNRHSGGTARSGPGGGKCIILDATPVLQLIEFGQHLQDSIARSQPRLHSLRLVPSF